METTEHAPDRPTWDCRACHDPWPCEPARNQMLEEMRPVELAIGCWTYLELAVHDMPGAEPAALFDRFLYWSRPHRLPNL